VLFRSARFGEARIARYGREFTSLFLTPLLRGRRFLWNDLAFHTSVHFTTHFCNEAPQLLFRFRDMFLSGIVKIEAGF